MIDFNKVRNVLACFAMYITAYCCTKIPVSEVFVLNMTFSIISSIFDNIIFKVKYGLNEAFFTILR
jgi:hypothetical protein